MALSPWALSEDAKIPDFGPSARPAVCPSQTPRPPGGLSANSNLVSPQQHRSHKNGFYDPVLPPSSGQVTDYSQARPPCFGFNGSSHNSVHLCLGSDSECDSIHGSYTSLHTTYLTNQSSSQPAAESSQTPIQQAAEVFGFSTDYENCEYICPQDLILQRPTRNAHLHIFPQNDYCSSDSMQLKNENTLSGEAETAGAPLNKKRYSSKRRTALAKDWLVKHSSSPYPSQDELQALSQATGQTVEQVKTCLSNLRSRMNLSRRNDRDCPMLGQGNNLTNASVSPPINEIGLIPTVHQNDYSTAIAPTMERYRSSDAGNITLISSPEDLEHPTSRASGYDIHFTSLTAPDATYEPMLHPQGDKASQASGRRGKRLYESRFKVNTMEASDTAVSDESNDNTAVCDAAYHCTVCTKSFKDSYRWRRHESGVHGFQTTEWICMPDTAMLDDLTCAFCSEFLPWPDHLEDHNVSKCKGKELKERTFSRKDLLKQHILQIHIPNADSAVKKSFHVPNSWARAVNATHSDRRSLWCGFCKAMFESTAGRMDHVAGHFRNGVDMSNWKPLGPE